MVIFMVIVVIIVLVIMVLNYIVILIWLLSCGLGVVVFGDIWCVVVIVCWLLIVGVLFFGYMYY